MSGNKGTVLALGYFDSVHVGHRAVIESAKEYAAKHGLTLTVFTFGGNLKAQVGIAEGKSVYLPSEREDLIKSLGVDEIYFAPVTKEFLSLDKIKFLQLLNEKYDIKCYVSGVDYSFGAFGQGKIQDIKEYATSRGQDQIVVETFNVGGQKVSTSLIKEILASGDISRANTLLAHDYFITGEVVRDRSVGKSIGFPTANVKPDKDKFVIKDGVYAGYVYIGGEKKSAVINYGARPTFNVNDEKVVETHIIDYDGDLYGKTIKVAFTARIRDIVAFKDKQSLMEQIQKDVSAVKGGNYD